MSFECPICFKEFSLNPDNTPKILRCGDTLCNKCLNQIYKSQKECPICRLEIKEKLKDIRINNYALSIKNIILCPLCSQEYDNTFNSEFSPKVLRCGDTLCLNCIKKNYKNNETFCFICRKINKENIDKLPVNKCVMELVENEILNNVEILGEVNSSENSRINNSSISINNSIKYDYEFNIGILGETYVGKTCITHYFYKGKTLYNSQPTIGLEFHYKILSIKGKKIKVRLYDTAGQEVYRSLSIGYLRSLNAAIIVFSVTMPYFEGQENEIYNEWKNADNKRKKEIEDELKKETFENIKSWLNQYNQINEENYKIVFLVGNKIDDVEKRFIYREDGLNFAKELSLIYFETSAITGENLYNIFSKLCLLLMKYSNLLKNDNKSKKIKLINDNNDGENNCSC